MQHMMKRDYVLNKMMFFIVSLFIPLIYIFQVSPLFIYSGIILGVIFNLFYYDSHNQVNRYMVSLPISKKQIVMARYAFLLTVMVFYLLYTWIIDALAHRLIPNLDILPDLMYAPISLRSAMMTFSVIMLIMTVVVPIYYFCQSFITSLLVQGGLLIIGFIGFAYLFSKLPESTLKSIANIAKWIYTNPTPFTIMFSIVTLAISYPLSLWIFTRKDIA